MTTTVAHMNGEVREIQIEPIGLGLQGEQDVGLLIDALERDELLPVPPRDGPVKYDFFAVGKGFQTLLEGDAVEAINYIHEGNCKRGFYDNVDEDDPRHHASFMALIDTEIVEAYGAMYLGDGVLINECADIMIRIFDYIGFLDTMNSNAALEFISTPAAVFTYRANGLWIFNEMHRGVRLATEALRRGLSPVGALAYTGYLVMALIEQYGTPDLKATITSVIQANAARGRRHGGKRF